MAWFFLNANVLVDDETIEINNVGELQLKDGNNTTDGIKFNHFNKKIILGGITDDDFYYGFAREYVEEEETKTEYVYTKNLNENVNVYSFNNKEITLLGTGTIENDILTYNENNYNRYILNDDYYIDKSDKRIVNGDVALELFKMIKNIPGQIEYYKEVSSFDGLTGDERTLYYLNTNDGNYKKGFYGYDNIDFVKLVGGAEADNITIEETINGVLQLKNGSNVDGVKFLHLNTNLYNSSVVNENNKLPLNSAVYKELLNSLSSLLEINNHKLKLVLVNNDNQEIFNKELTIEQSIIQNNTNLIENNAVWKELMDTVNSYYKIESNKLKLKIQNNNADVLLNSELDIDVSPTENSTNLINSNAVYKELLNNTNSVFEYDNTNSSKDVINLKLQNNNSTDKIDKTIDFNDKLVLETKTQTITNKTIDVDDNTISNIETDNFKSGVITNRLSTDYYFSWVNNDTYIYTKTANAGDSISCYSITVESGDISEITLLGNGVIANEKLTYDSVEYSREVNNDGFYVVNEKKKLITISALTDIMEKAGRVNDVKFGNKSIVNNKVATLNKIDNLEDNYYYSFKNGSNYIYIKTKAIGTNKNTYTFTFTDNVLTKITLSDKKSEIKVENGYLVAVHNGTTYSYDSTKDNYYVIDPTDKTSSIQASVMEKDLSRCFEGFYETPQNNDWKYVGYLGGSSGSTLTVNDDWSELLFVARLQENSAYYNDGKIIPKVVFTAGSPTNNNVFVGFYWNDNYTYKSRIGLYGSGTNRYIKNDYPRSDMWTIQGFYIYKR